MKATVSIYIFKTKAKQTKDGKCPVKLQVIHNRTQRYFSISKRIKNNDWEFISPDDIKKIYPINDSGKPYNPRGIYKDIRNEYERIIKEVEKIINDLPHFSFNLFKDAYTQKTGPWDNVFAALWMHIQDLKAEERFGYANTFNSTLRAVKEFHTGKTYNFNPRKDKIENRGEVYLSGRELKFIDINSTWLRKFEKSMKSKGKSETTIGIYMRNLRVVFNRAINKEGVKAPYPFNDYKPTSTEQRKIGLEPFQIAAILNYETKHPLESKYRDLFMMSFFCNGANLSDLLRLKQSDLADGRITFERFKTKNKKAKTKIAVEINETLQVIIDRLRVRAIGHDGYLLEFLKPEWTEEQCFAKIKQEIKNLNRYIRIIAKEVGIKQTISSYSARHAYANIQSESGVSTLNLKDLLGHSSSTVTELYLKRIGRKKGQKISNNLENIIKKA